MITGKSAGKVPNVYILTIKRWSTSSSPHYMELLYFVAMWDTCVAFTCRLSPADAADGGGSQNKGACCHGGLPWWFIFFGWLLVVATSCVAGFFTMLYGLKFGKPRSISWLVSMVVSFFQSILIIQPLKVEEEVDLMHLTFTK